MKWEINPVYSRSYVKFELSDSVSVMEALQFGKTNRNDVVRKIKEAQVQHGEFVAVVAFAEKVTGSMENILNIQNGHV